MDLAAQLGSSGLASIEEQLSRGRGSEDLSVFMDLATRLRSSGLASVEEEFSRGRASGDLSAFMDLAAQLGRLRVEKLRSHSSFLNAHR